MLAQKNKIVNELQYSETFPADPHPKPLLIQALLGRTDQVAAAAAVVGLEIAVAASAASGAIVVVVLEPGVDWGKLARLPGATGWLGWVERDVVAEHQLLLAAAAAGNKSSGVLVALTSVGARPWVAFVA